MQGRIYRGGGGGGGGFSPPNNLQRYKFLNEDKFFKKENIIIFAHVVKQEQINAL